MDGFAVTRSVRNPTSSSKPFIVGRLNLQKSVRNISKAKTKQKSCLFPVAHAHCIYTFLPLCFLFLFNCNRNINLYKHSIQKILVLTFHETLQNSLSHEPVSPFGRENFPSTSAISAYALTCKNN